MEATLAKNPKNWFAGDFTAADIIMSFPVELMDHLKGDLKNYLIWPSMWRPTTSALPISAPWSGEASSRCCTWASTPDEMVS